MSRGYDRRAVEALLTTLWDEDVVWGLKQEEVPDPQMPKAKANPAHGNTLAAMLADISRAWKHCEIPLNERRVIVLHYGFDLPHELVGHILGVPKSTAHLRSERAVGRVTAWLNGDKYGDETKEVPDE